MGSLKNQHPSHGNIKFSEKSDKSIAVMCFALFPSEIANSLFAKSEKFVLCFFTSTGYHTCGKCHPCIMRMIGTCIPLCGFFPGLVFGDGNFPTEPAMTAMRMNTTLIACKTNSTTLTSNQVTTLRTLTATSSTSMPITKFTSIISTKNKTFFPSKKFTPNSITTTIIEPYTNQLTMIPTPTNYTLGENSPLSARSTTMSTTSRTMATIAQNIITTPNATLENTTSTLNIIRATTSFNHTLHSNALTMSGSVLPNSSSINFTTLTPTTLTQATKLTSNITSPYTTSTIATPIPSTISTSITKSLPTISVPITYTQTTKPTSTTINPSGSLFFTTTTMSSPYPALAPTTSPTTTTITQVTIPVPITFAKILTTTKSTTSKHVHTTTTVPTTYMPTTILTAPLQATELYTCKSSMPSGCLVVTTDKTFQSPRSLSFFFKNSGAILAGTVGSLVFIGAATWICFSHAAQYKRGLLLSRRVSPARTQNPDNDIENNIIDV